MSKNDGKDPKKGKEESSSMNLRWVNGERVYVISDQHYSVFTPVMTLGGAKTMTESLYNAIQQREQEAHDQQQRAYETEMRKIELDRAKLQHRIETWAYMDNLLTPKRKKPQVTPVDTEEDEGADYDEEDAEGEEDFDESQYTDLWDEE